MKRKALQSYEKTPATDGVSCYGCREAFEISLLIPPLSRGGNQRRFKRYYQCENCQRMFTKYDWGYALMFMFSPKRIAEYLFRSPRTRLRDNEALSERSASVRGQFRPVDFAAKKSREKDENAEQTAIEGEPSNRKQDQKSDQAVEDPHLA